MKIFEFFNKPFEWYENWKYPKKFKIGDKVRDKVNESFWQDLTVVKYDFCFNGSWWVYCEDNDPKHEHITKLKRIPFREYQLELLPPEFLQYDPKQQGDTDDDI